MKFLLFDFLLYFFGTLIYGLAFCISGTFLQLFWGETLWINAFILFPTFLVFIYSFILTLGLVKNIVQPRLREGHFPIGLGKDYIAWGLNSIFCSLFLTLPLAQIGHIGFVSNWLFYRLMGMKVPFNTLIGLNTVIRQPELITIGEKSIIGLGAIMSCHFTADGKTHTQLPIKIGTKSVIGGYSSIAPAITVGDNSVIGAQSKVLTHTTIGNNVKIGAFCLIDSKCNIPDNIKIKSNSRIRRTDQIKSGEIWSGDPAQKVGEL